MQLLLLFIFFPHTIFDSKPAIIFIDNKTNKIDTDMNTIIKLIVKFDIFLYKKFGVVSVLRKWYWRKSAQSIQVELDKQHEKRDKFNSLLGVDYTTKRVMEIIGK